MELSPASRDPEPFELSGGALCLDFANSWGNQADPSSDKLRDYQNLLEFARQTEILPTGALDELQLAARKDPSEADAALGEARELRQSVYRIFSSRADCREVPLAEVGRINAGLGEALSHRRLGQRGDEFSWSWSPASAENLRSPLWPVLESAATLLASEDLGRVRECDADDCNWLFLDRSRGGNRRWCSMKSCGNRAKARRHYRREKKHSSRCG